MSNKEQKKSEEKTNEEILTEKCSESSVSGSNVFTEHVIDDNRYNEEIESLKTQLAEAKNHERDSILRVKAEMENLRRRTEQDIEKVHKFALEKFVNELLPVIDSLDRALEVASESSFDQSAMIEGINLTLKSMYDVIHKFGVKIVSDVDVPLDPNVHQAIAMVESENVTAGNVLKIMQKGYILNGRTIRAAMVTVAKAKCENNPKD